MVWREVENIYNLPRGLSLLTNITQDFTPLNMDYGFQSVGPEAIAVVHKLFEGETLQLFEHLATEFALPRTDFV